MFYRFSLYGFLKNLRFFDPFILLIFRSYGLSFLQIGLLYSIRDIATNLLEIPTGVLADSFGRRKAMIAAFLSYILSFLILYFMMDFWSLALAMILFAFGEAFRSGTHKALIFEYLEIRQISHLKIAYYGLTRSASQFGSAINALIAAGLVFYTGNYRVMFLASTIPYTLDLINLISYPKALDGNITRVKGKEVWTRIVSTFTDFIQTLKDASILRVLLSSASFTGVFKTTKDYLQPLLAFFALSLLLFPDLEDTRREALIIGLVYFVIYLLTSLASSRAYAISNWFSYLPRAVNVTYILGIVLLLISGITAALGFELIAVICFVGMFLLNNIRRPINIGIISEQISSNVMASGLSTETLLTTIFSAFFAPLLGAVVDNMGLGYGISIMGIVMFLLYFLVRVKVPGESQSGN
ncbi:MAG: MFS transporter [Chloroflexi bacterium]|nr:MFS transporter [Chloroflexota bacterium]